MSTELKIWQRSWWRDGWPGGLGTFLGMSSGFGLKRWLPLHYAMGIGCSAAWFVAGLIYARRSSPKYGIPVWLAALITGLAGRLSIGVLSYYFPW